MPKNKKKQGGNKKVETKVTEKVVTEETKVEETAEPSTALETTPTATQPPEEERKAKRRVVPGALNSKGPPLKRKGSKFDLMGDGGSPLLRPEFVYRENEESSNKIWELMQTYQGTDIKSIQRSIVNHVEYTLAMTRFNFTNFGCYQATAFSLRDRLLESWNDTNQYFTTNNVKRVYYLSLEFLLGRLMQNTLNNIDLEQKYKDALMDIGYHLEDLYDHEVDPALGNGGLGRLAA